mmetsp:Transcript_71227/g.206278  ORF Transcript_71227/g.206278 Transcript_71227/m.206278 type:complete len:250 (+) Transcript_71227:582-1331(+)
MLWQYVATLSKSSSNRSACEAGKTNTLARRRWKYNKYRRPSCNAASAGTNNERSCPAQIGQYDPVWSLSALPPPTPQPSPSIGAPDALAEIGGMASSAATWPSSQEPGASGFVGVARDAADMALTVSSIGEAPGLQSMRTTLLKTTSEWPTLTTSLRPRSSIGGLCATPCSPATPAPGSGWHLQSNNTTRQDDTNTAAQAIVCLSLLQQEVRLTNKAPVAKWIAQMACKLKGTLVRSAHRRQQRITQLP